MSLFSHLRFVMAGLRNPGQVSTVVQTSKTTVNRLLRPVDILPSVSLLELGVGAGAVTRGTAQFNLKLEQYLGIELNPELAQFAQKEFPHLKIVQGSAVDISKLVKGWQPNLVVSTLPWTLFSAELRREILVQIAQVLSSQGFCSTYMVVPNCWSESANRFIAEASDIFTLQQSYWVLRNFPPAKVLVFQKK
jgi:phosphatidylethanolamine/phosphatidyl-N-methylethanolamine N-methyltransferase